MSNEPTTVYVLLADGDGCLHSIDEPFGVAVTSEEEAQRYVKDGAVGYTHSYRKLRVFDNKDEAIRWRYTPRRIEDGVTYSNTVT